jgi:hypothetical protein
MKHYALVSCLLIALTAASCTASHNLVELDGVHFKRVASIENRCKDDADCEKQASDYATSHSIPMPEPVSFNPRVYSFSEGNGANKQEILYKVSLLSPTSITYYETKKIPGSGYKDNVRLLKDAVDALKGELGADLTETTQSAPDNYQTNRKIPCRVLLNTKKPIELKDSKGNKFASIRGDFGVIINPPYPP